MRRIAVLVTAVLGALVAMLTGGATGCEEAPGPGGVGYHVSVTWWHVHASETRVIDGKTRVIALTPARGGTDEFTVTTKGYFSITVSARGMGPNDEGTFGALISCHIVEVDTGKTAMPRGYEHRGYKAIPGQIHCDAGRTGAGPA